MKRILGITGIRSDYDLMSVLYRKLAADRSIDFRLLVGGAHLSKTYGYSVDLIRADGISILARIESLIDADSKTSRLKSASVMLQSAVDIVAAWDPELILFAGDREEVWVGALLGNYLDIPTVHFYGGDYTLSWHVDNIVRNSVSKLSTFHVVTTEEHRLRLLAIGEPSERIRVLGSLSLDNFVAQEAMNSEQLRSTIGLRAELGDYAMVLFHPDPSEQSIAGSICVNILQELKAADLGACIGYPNTDPANREIINAFDAFKHEPRFFFYRNLERRAFISMYRKAKFIIGNSSSGILEAASVPIPAINVGLRQRGRHAGKNVIFVDTDRASIKAAIARACSASFRSSIAGMTNPYGDGNSAKKAYDLITQMDFSRFRVKTEDPLQPYDASGALPAVTALEERIDSADSSPRNSTDAKFMTSSQDVKVAGADGKVLVIAPHPDDETLGCGGTLLRMREEGAQLAWLIVTAVSEQSGWTPERVRERDREIDRVTQLMGFAQVFNLRLPTGQLDQVPMWDLINQFASVFKSFEPELVLFPSAADAHTDHRVVSHAVVACTKWFRYPSVKRVLAYETISETGYGLGDEMIFSPNYFVDIGPYVERKLEVMATYHSEMGAFPFPRSAEAIRALATVRGAAAGFRAAEAFQLLRERH